VNEMSKKIIDIFVIGGIEYYSFNDGSSERATSEKAIGQWVHSNAKSIPPMTLKNMMVFG
jgi:hypothetical protein